MQINGFGAGDTAELSGIGTGGIKSGTSAGMNTAGIQGERGGASGVGAAFAVDFDGDRSRTGSYAEKKRTAEEVMTDAANTDSSIRHNFLNLMANTMSDEDFARGMEEGFDLSETDPAESVTILDHIKAAVALSGTEVKGFTDDLDVKQLEKITGSSGMAQKLATAFAVNDIPVTDKNVKEAVAAADMAAELTPMSDAAVVYMVENNLEPTIDNLYLAQHSTGTGTAGTGSRYAGTGTAADIQKGTALRGSSMEDKALRTNAGGQQTAGLQDGLNAPSGAVRSRGRASFYAQEKGYYAQRAEVTDWDALKNQVRDIAEKAGFDPDDEGVMNEARTMIEEGLPLTPGNLEKVVTLKNMELPVMAEDAVDPVVAAMAGGRAARDSGIGDTESDLEKAARYVQEYSEVTDETLRQTIAAKKALNLRSFREKADEQARQLVEDNDPELARARKDLEQVRLSMSVEANLRLMRLGVQIDTAPVRELVRALDDVLADMEKSIMGKTDTVSAKEAGEEQEPSDSGKTADIPRVITDNKYLLFKENIVRVNRVRTAPVEMVGRLSAAENSGQLTLKDICDTGEHIRDRYDRAQDSYEALMTAPRADLGDSIKKAFRNVDDILEDLDFELSDENRRAVRILGYNHMELTPENIERVRTYDRKLVSTVDALRPESVLEFIRDGHNPLSMTLDELRQDLDSREKDKDRSQEKYSKFLYKLEKNADITPEEKESYIGIYRLFHRLKATDDAAIGALLKTGAQMTLGNLLTAVRSGKIEGRGLDVRVDEDFGGLVAGRRKNAAIDDQIRAAFDRYSAEADIVYDNLEPEKLHRAEPGDATTLPELAEELAAAEKDIELDREYYREQAQNVRMTVGGRSAESAAEELSRFDETVTAASIRAMQGMRADRAGGTGSPRFAGTGAAGRGRGGRTSGDQDRTIWDSIERLANKSYSAARQEMAETLGEAEDYALGYKEALNEIGDELYDMAMEETVNHIDAAALGLIRKQLSITARMADRNSFEVPVEIDGQTISMHVTIASDEESGGRKVSAAVSTVDHGDLEMAVTVNNGRLSGILTSSYGSEDGQREYMEGVRDRFVQDIADTLPGIEAEPGDINVFYRTVDAVDRITGAENGFSGTKELLRMARSFVKAVTPGY